MLPAFAQVCPFADECMYSPSLASTRASTPACKHACATRTRTPMRAAVPVRAARRAPAQPLRLFLAEGSVWPGGPLRRPAPRVVCRRAGVPLCIAESAVAVGPYAAALWLGDRRGSRACGRAPLAGEISGIGLRLNALHYTLSFRPPLQLVRCVIATSGRCVLTIRFGLRIENSPDEPTVVGSALGVFSCPARDATADTVCFDAVIPCALNPRPLFAAAAAAHFASPAHGACAHTVGCAWMDVLTAARVAIRRCPARPTWRGCAASLAESFRGATRCRPSRLPAD
jgi:hypothetical protein